MKVLLDIKDNKADFAMELLKNLSCVKVKPFTKARSQLADDINNAVLKM